MTKRQLLVMAFVCTFAFGGVFGEFSTLEAKPRKKTTQTGKKKTTKNNKKSKNTKKSSGNKTSKKNTKKSSGKTSKKKSGKKTSKKKGSKRYSKKKRNTSRVRTPRTGNVYTSPSNTYTPPKTYDNNSNGTEEKSDRQYKRENTDPVKKEPKKDGE